jgi:hypothetical protein
MGGGLGDGLGDGMGDTLGSDLPDLGALPMGDGLGDFSVELNEDEVSELAGLNTGT